MCVCVWPYKGKCSDFVNTVFILLKCTKRNLTGLDFIEVSAELHGEELQQYQHFGHKCILSFICLFGLEDYTNKLQTAYWPRTPVSTRKTSD